MPVQKHLASPRACRKLRTSGELLPRHPPPEEARSSRRQYREKPSEQKRRAKDEVSWVKSLLRTARNNSLPGKVWQPVLPRFRNSKVGGLTDFRDRHSFGWTSRAKCSILSLLGCLLIQSGLSRYPEN